MIETQQDQKCGFVALVGMPNAGKSTLLNQLVGTKLAIVSAKVQTTRAKLLGIVIEDQAQIILIDTPGIFTPARRLEKAMVQAAWTGAEEADQVVVLIDVSKKKIADETKDILQNLVAAKRQIVIALNKIDLVDREKLLAIASECQEICQPERIFMISALNGSGVADLRQFLAEQAPVGPWHYPEDQISDAPMRYLAAEITREKLFNALHDELPYALTVETDKWETFRNGSVKITQTIFVNRDSQKSIVLGKSGQQIKIIGQRARQDIAALIETEVHLFLFVKVRDKWQDDPNRYEAMGLEYQ